MNILDVSACIAYPSTLVNSLNISFLYPSNHNNLLSYEYTLKNVYINGHINKYNDYKLNL